LCQAVNRFEIDDLRDLNALCSGNIPMLKKSPSCPVAAHILGPTLLCLRSFIVPLLVVISTGQEIVQNTGNIVPLESKASPANTDNNALKLLQATNPFLKLITNSENKVLLDYRYFSTNIPAGRLLPTIAIEESGGAISQNARHTIQFEGNLNRADAFTIKTPDNRILQGKPVALSISDGQGNRTWLGQIKDCQGEIIGPGNNQVRFQDAFSGILADIVYTYEANFIEQDVVLREKPLLPEGLDEETARLEVWTEFFQTNDPIKAIKMVQFGKRIVGDHEENVIAEDQSLTFGTMRMVQGKAFMTRTGEDPLFSARSPQAAVIKEWVVKDTQKFLKESVDFLSLKPALERLNRVQAFSAPIRSAKDYSYLVMDRSARFSSPRTRSIVASSFKKGSMSGAAIYPTGGVVIDWRIVTFSLLNVNFGIPFNGGTHGTYSEAEVYEDSNDFWNGVQTPNASSGTFSNLKWVDGVSNSGVELVLENAAGIGSVSCMSQMLSGYVYNNVSGSITVRLKYIPTGRYDFYIYGVAGNVGSVNGNYVLSVNGVPQGQKQTTATAGWASLFWSDKEHYVVYPNILVSDGQEVTITALNGTTSALLNGLQIVSSGSINTAPTIDNIPDQNTIPGTGIGPIGFNISDTETAPTSLNVSAQSSDQTILPNANIILGGNGQSRTIILNPVPGKTGSSIITVTVSDGIARANSTFRLVVLPTSTLVQVDRSLITSASTDCSSYFPAAQPGSGGYDWLPSRAIDGVIPVGTTDICWHSGITSQGSNNEWFRLNLNASYTVAQVQYYPRGAAWNGSFLHYQIFVSSDPAVWGTPVADGYWSWPNGAEVKTITLTTPKQGQYVIFKCLDGVNGWASAGEVWVYRTSTQPPDNDGDGIPDDWESQNGLNPGSNTDRDLDLNGDGITNYREFRKTKDVMIFATKPAAYESGQQGGFTIYAPSHSSPVAVTLSVTGNPLRYTATPLLSSPITIPVGQDSVNVAIVTSDNQFYDGVSSLTCQITAVTIGGVASTAFDSTPATVRLIDDEFPASITLGSYLPTVTLSVIDSDARESLSGSPKSGIFRISRNDFSGHALPVKFSLSGTAVEGSDYLPREHTAFIAAGQTFVDVLVTPINDNDKEFTETVVGTLIESPAYVLGGSVSGSINIDDDETPIYIISAVRSLGYRDAYLNNRWAKFILSRTGSTLLPSPSITVTASSRVVAGEAANNPSITLTPGSSLPQNEWTVNFDSANLTAPSGWQFPAPAPSSSWGVAFKAGSAHGYVSVAVKEVPVYVYKSEVTLSLSGGTTYPSSGSASLSLLSFYSGPPQNSWWQAPQASIQAGDSAMAVAGTVPNQSLVFTLSRFKSVDFDLLHAPKICYLEFLGTATPDIDFSINLPPGSSVESVPIFGPHRVKGITIPTGTESIKVSLTPIGGKFAGIKSIVMNQLEGTSANPGIPNTPGTESADSPFTLLRTLAFRILGSDQVTDQIPDTDGDGLNDSDEILIGTNPGARDSDNDGLNDFIENNILFTSPLAAQTTYADLNNDGLEDHLQFAGMLFLGDTDRLALPATGEFGVNGSGKPIYVNDFAEILRGTDPSVDRSGTGADLTPPIANITFSGATLKRVVPAP
jgi:hypothetical protein